MKLASLIIIFAFVLDNVVSESESGEDEGYEDEGNEDEGYEDEESDGEGIIYYRLLILIKLTCIKTLHCLIIQLNWRLAAEHHFR